MFIVIDDTYGPESDSESNFVTGRRRTHVAVRFKDSDVNYLRKQIIECLELVSRQTGKTISEFHFVDIYNRNDPWNNLDEYLNLKVIKFFAYIYKQHKWPVVIQTIDDRTLNDHKIKEISGKIEGLNLSNRDDLSLVFLLIKIKHQLKKQQEPISLIIDEGKKKPGIPVGKSIFHDWECEFNGIYKSSASEPLLQLADFIAFCINRSTHLGMKSTRTPTDNWFLDLVGNMGIMCDDLNISCVPEGFSVTDFDHLHELDRKSKGL